jgi:molybdenum cofactor cytidylyltransferase
VLVVLGNEANRVSTALAPCRAQRVDNPRYADGLSTSLQAGLDGLSDDSDGALILLADMPRISPATVEAVLAAARETPTQIIAANQRGRPAPPVYWPRASFPALHAIRGDEGGRSILLRSLDTLRLIEPTQPDEALDVDAPDDYQRIQGKPSDTGG